MTSINVRVDENLKNRSFAALEKLGLTPSEYICQTLDFVA